MATDLFNRNIPAELPIADMMARLKAPTDNKVSRDDSSSKTNEAYDRLYSAVKDLAAKIDPKLNDDVKGSEDWAKKVIDFINNSKPSNSENKESTVRDQTNYLAIMAEATTRLWEASQSQNTLWVGLAHLTGRAQKDIAQAIDMSNCCGATSKSMSEAADKIAKSSETSSQKVQEAIHESMKSTGKSAGSNKDSLPRSKDTESSENLDTSALAAGGKKALLFAIALTALNKAVQAFDKVAHELEINIGRIIPSIKDANNYRESLRSIIHMQEGFGNANRNIEKQYRHITEAVYASGVARSEYQKIYLKNLERGLDTETALDRAAVDAMRVDGKELTLDKKKEQLLNRRASRMKSIQTSALNTATMLGMSGESMNELFMDWHYQLGLSSVELANMGRHMQQIARSSGLTGVQLEQAMQSSNAVIKNMQKQGSASLNNMKKVTEFMATAKKIGFEGSEEMITALSDGRAFAESSMNAFLAQSARLSADPSRALRNLQTGTTLEDPEGMKNLAGGMENKIEFLFDKIAGKQIDLTTDEFAATKALQEMRMSGNAEERAKALQLQNIFKAMGVPLGEAEKAVRSLKDASLPLGQRLKKADDELKKMKNLEGTDKFKQQQKVVDEMQTSLYANAFGALEKYEGKLGKGFQGLDAASKESLTKTLEQEFGDRTQALDFLNNMSKGGQDLLSKLNVRSKDAGLSGIDEIFQRKGMDSKSVLAGIQKGDQKALQTLNEAMQEISTREKAQQDPITDIRDILRRWNTWFGGYFDAASFGMPDWAVQVIYLLGTIVSLTFKVIAGIASLYAAFKIGSFLRGGAAAAGGGAGGGAAAAGGGAAASKGWWGRLKDRFTGNKSAIPPATGSPTPHPLPTSSTPPVKTPPVKGGLGRFASKNKFAIAATLLASTGAYLWATSGKDKSTGGDSLPEADDVLSVLKQIEINTRCLCQGGAGGAVSGASGGTSTGNMTPENLSGTNTTAPEALADETQGMSLATQAGLASAMFLPSPSVGKVMGFAQPAITPPAITPPTPTSTGSLSASPKISPPSLPPAASGGGFLSSLYNKATNAYKGVTSMVGGAYNTAKGVVGGAYNTVKGVAGSAYNTASGVVGQAGNFIADKTGIKKLTEFLNSNIGRVLPKFLIQGGGLLKSGLGNLLNKIPVVGAIIQAIMTGMNVNQIAKQQGMSKEEIYSLIGKEVLAGGLSLIGGTLAGAGLGTLLSIPPMTGWGSAIGGFVGYMGGSYLGDMLGRAIADYVGGPALGKMIFDMFYEDKGTTTPKAETTEATVPAFEVGTREIKQGGLAELHKGEMVIPSRIWDKIVAIGSGAFGAGTDVTSIFSSLGKSLNPFSTFDKLMKISTKGFKTEEAGTDVTSIFSSLGKSLNPFSTFDKLMKISMKGFKTEEGQPSDIASLIVAIKQLIDAIRSEKCCDVGAKYEGAFEEDQAKTALESGITTSLKMKTLNLEEPENLLQGFGFYKKRYLKMAEKSEDAKETPRQSGKGIILSNLLSKAFEFYKSTMQKSFSSVANLGVFDKEKVTEAQDYYSEGVNKSFELTKKFEPNNLTFKKMDYMEGASYPILGEYLYKTLENLKKIPQAIMKPLGLGLFDNKNTDEANEMQTTASAIQQQFKAMGMPLGEYVAAVESLKAAAIEKDYNTSVDAVGLSMGLFDPEKSSEANDDYMRQTIAKSMGIPLQEFNEAIKASVANKTISEKTEKNIIAEVSKALNYDTAPSDAANQTLVTTNSLDYSDQMRGEVGSLALSRVAAESAVAQAKYGDSPSGNTAVLPSMDTIADYLVVEQARKLDQMILVMEQIRDRLSMSGPTGSQIIGANSAMLPPSTRPGIKSISQDLLRGYWDLTFDDPSPGAVTTDGRGGK